MNVNLGTVFDKFVAGLLKSGLYQSQSEVVREGLRLLKERDKHVSRLRSDIGAGFDAIRRGEYDDYDEHTTRRLADNIKKRGRQRVGKVLEKTGAR